jgi:hypothetical protein
VLGLTPSRKRVVPQSGTRIDNNRLPRIALHQFAQKPRESGTPLHPGLSCPRPARRDWGSGGGERVASPYLFRMSDTAIPDSLKISTEVRSGRVCQKWLGPRRICHFLPKLLFTPPLFSSTWAEISCISLITKIVIAIHVSRKDLYLHSLAHSPFLPRDPDYQGAYEADKRDCPESPAATGMTIFRRGQ